MLVGVPVAAAVAALISLRRVQISPLGVSRRATPKPPTFWRLAPLVLGLGLYVYGLSKTTHQSIGAPAYPGLLITMIGLVIAGPWLTSVSVAAVRPPHAGIVGAAGDPAAGRQPEGRVPFGDRARARRLPRHDGGHAGARGERDRGEPSDAALRNVLLDQVGLDSQQGAKLLSGLSADPRRHCVPAVFAADAAAASGRVWTWRHSGSAAR